MKLSFSLLAIPLSIPVAAMCLNTPVISALFYHVLIPFIHECGHAFFFSLGARVCIPTPVFFTPCFTQDFTTWFYLLVLVLLGFAAYSFRKKKKQILSIVFAAFFLLYLLLPALLPSSFLIALGVFGGLAGELLIGAGLILIAHCSWSTRKQWKLERLPILLIGMCSLEQGLMLWLRVVLGKAQLPYGARLGPLLEGGHDNGDLNRLTADFALSESTIIYLYVLTSLIAILIVLACYLFQLREYKRSAQIS